MSILRSITFLLPILYLYTGVCQTQPKGAETAKILQQKYEKSPAVALLAETTFTFRLDAKTNTPYLVEEENWQLMSLRIHNTVVRQKYYDGQSEIDRVTCTTDKGKSLSVASVCGNYEVDDIFFSDAKVCRYGLSFTNVGEVQQLKLQKTYRDLKYFTSVYFHDIYPIRVRKYKFIVPDWLQVELKEFNFAGYHILKKETPDAKSKATVIEYTVENLDDLKGEKYAQGHSFTYPHLLVLSKQMQIGNQTKPLLASLDDLYGWYASLALSVRNDRKPLEATVKELVAGKNTDEAKIKAIYYWVQDNIRYIAFEDGIAGFKPETAHTVFQNRYGDCKGMANLTKEMLKIAGYDARLTWIGTSKIAYDYSLPSLAVDNHMICTLLHNGKRYFLDATEKFASLHENAERIQNRPVLIENGKQYLLDKVPVDTKERNHIATEQVAQLDGNALKIKGKTEFNGEMKKGLFNILHELPSERRTDFLEKSITQSNKNILVQKSETKSLFNREAPFVVAYDLVANNCVSSFDSDVYVDLDLNHDFADFEIEPDRVSEVAFGEKIFRTSQVRFRIPATYKATYLPKSFEKQLEAFSIKLHYTELNGEIIYEKQIAVNKGLLQKGDFTAWNEAMRELKKVYNDKIILTKL